MAASDEFDELIESVVHGAVEVYVQKMTEALTKLLVEGVENPDMLSTFAARAKQEAFSVFERYRGRIAKETQQAFLQAVENYNDEVEQTLQGTSITPKYALTKQGKLELAQAARGVAEVIRRQNISLAHTASDTWFRVASKAIVRKELGDSYRSIMEDCVSELSDAGIQTIDYKSGIKTTIDAAVRRHIVSQTSQAKAHILDEACEEFDHDLVFVSSHFGARPTHAMWQGKVYSRSGTSKKYPSLDEGTGYNGTGPFGSLADRLCGVNCRHDMTPYMEGLSELPDTKFEEEQKRCGMTSDEFYKATQKQRAYEREVRKYKRRISVGQAQDLDMMADRRRLGHTQALLREHCRENNLRRDYERERAYGVAKQPRGLGRLDFKNERPTSRTTIADAAAARAEKLLEKATAAEPAVTQMLESLQTNSRKLVGLEFKLKSKESLARKVALHVNEREQKLNTKTRINDVLRYTFQSNNESFTSDFKTVRSSLERSGYTFTRVKNTLQDETASYRGVNTQIKTPEGYTFELQFHTPESLAVKEKNHVLYEQQRILDKSAEDYTEKYLSFNQQMISNAKCIPLPSGIDEVKK